ncbi:MAG: MipA/OmpV family protein [Gammaproteobacteria bacterium]|nr:MAG: MipA/OmpV family protein [Gammaproteobacteria bacterium]
MYTPKLPSLVLLTAAALAAAACAAVRAEPRPLWEFGLGAGALVFNDYRGADSVHVYPVPVPYLVYRGKFLRSDQRGLRGRLLDQDRIELNLSVNGTTPVRSDSSRHGMPDLRPTLEIGPSLDVHLWKSAAALLRLDLRLPARAAFTVEAAPSMIGLFLAPHLNLDLAQRRGPDGWKLGLLAGPLFANRRYDNYFYGVAPRYATAERPAFRAHGGYAGTQFIAALTRRYPACWLGAYLRHDTLGGASFADSPLISRDSYWSGGFGIAWIIRRSSRLVDSED